MKPTATGRKLIIRWIRLQEKDLTAGNTFVSGWDTIFDISGFRTVVTVKNGSWYDTDTGVVPDVYLSDPELFYNRARLTELINALN